MAPVLINKLDSVLSGLLDVEWLYVLKDCVIFGLLDVEWLYVLKDSVIFGLSLEKSFDLVFY